MTRDKRARRISELVITKWERRYTCLGRDAMKFVRKAVARAERRHGKMLCRTEERAS